MRAESLFEVNANEMNIELYVVIDPEIALSIFDKKNKDQRSKIKNIKDQKSIFLQKLLQSMI